MSDDIPNPDTSDRRGTGAPGRLGRADREAFLAEPWIGVLSVEAGPDRPPSTLPTWYAYRAGGDLTVITRGGRRKSRLIADAGRVSFSVQDPRPPYRYVTIEGDVVRQEPPRRDELVAVFARYLPADQVEAHTDWELDGEHPNGSAELVVIRPRRWLTADFSATG